jgi:hypothetical protein
MANKPEGFTVTRRIMIDTNNELISRQISARLCSEIDNGAMSSGVRRNPADSFQADHTAHLNIRNMCNIGGTLSNCMLMPPAPSKRPQEAV